MGFFSWVILGLIAGALGKLLMPGKQGGGWIVTILLGIVGAFVGGWLGTLVGFGSITGVNLASIATAAIGAFIVLFIYGLVSKK
ncbi:MAG: putative transglycosylase associated protein [Verrucomicrobiaceae bacterium]|nr:putative transglycosylase associated protein [Verrucomicrobiaceae bacterium]